VRKISTSSSSKMVLLLQKTAYWRCTMIIKSISKHGQGQYPAIAILIFLCFLLTIL